MPPARTLSALAALSLCAAFNAQAHAEQPYHHYVSLGDSYVSKPGILDADNSSPSCNRTNQNYPTTVANGLGLKKGSGFTDASCGGATTSDLAQPQRFSNSTTAAPQLDAVTADTDLVTLGMGGNDGGWFGDAIGTCAKLGLTDLGGNPCEQKGPEQSPVLGDEGFAAARSAARDNLIAAANTIREKAPNSKLLLVGYPHIFPSDKQCAASFPFAKGDLPWLDTRVRQLNTALKDVAESTGNEYIDVYTPSQGHDLCGAGQAWISGLLTANLLDSAPVHPTPEGARHTGAIVLQAL